MVPNAEEDEVIRQSLDVLAVPRSDKLEECQAEMSLEASKCVIYSCCILQSWEPPRGSGRSSRLCIGVLSRKLYNIMLVFFGYKADVGISTAMAA